LINAAVPCDKWLHELWRVPCH